jgi:hypothetical protein
MNKIKQQNKRISIVSCLFLLVAIFGVINCEKKKEDKNPLLLGAAALSLNRSPASSTSPSFTIGGSVSDLWTSGLVLQNNSGEEVTLTPNLGSEVKFTFPTKVGAYAVTIKTQPLATNCTVTKGSGTATANVADVSINCITNIGGGILKLLSNLTWAVTVFAGPANGTTTSGTTNGTGNAARFTQPSGITTDGTNLYVCDDSHVIRRIVISSGAVTTFAGTSGSAGRTDGTGAAARFEFPKSITTDGTNLYVTEDSNKIRKIVIATGVVTTFAGAPVGTNTSGDTDGTGTAARFNSPIGITNDGTNLYVADQSNNKIRKIVIATGEVTTLAGPAQGTITSGDLDGTGNAARFGFPRGITTDGTNLYVSEFGNYKIRKIVISTGVVTVLAGPANGTVTFGDLDGTGNSARFNNLNSITTDGTNIYVADQGNHKIRRIVIATGVVTTPAGPAQGTSTSGDLDGTGNAVRFNNPTGITTDGTSLYVTDYSNNKIRRIQ